MAEEEKQNYYVNGNEDTGEVEEVWESYSGDLWFICESDPKHAAFGYARLSQMPQFAEWGSINRRELVENPKVWQVARKNWPNVNTYEEGLLVQG